VFHEDMAGITLKSSSCIFGSPDFLPTTAGSLCRNLHLASKRAKSARYQWYHGITPDGTRICHRPQISKVQISRGTVAFAEFHAETKKHLHQHESGAFFSHIETSKAYSAAFFLTSIKLSR
jgi:hypothetical protein